MSVLHHSRMSSIHFRVGGPGHSSLSDRQLSLQHDIVSEKLMKK